MLYSFPAVSLLWLGGKGFPPGAILQIFVIGPFDNYVDLLLLLLLFIAEPSWSTAVETSSANPTTAPLRAIL